VGGSFPWASKEGQRTSKTGKPKSGNASFKKTGGHTLEPAFLGSTTERKEENQKGEKGKKDTKPPKKTQESAADRDLINFTKKDTARLSGMQPKRGGGGWGTPALGLKEGNRSLFEL